MIKIYSTIFLCIFMLACSENEIILTENDLPEDMFYLKDDIRPFSGTCIIYYHGTKLIKERMHFKNGILEGLHTSYYKNGQIKRTGTYLQGNLHGTWTSFDLEGNKIYEVTYENDTLIGSFYSWYNTGVLKEKGCFLKNRRNGEWVQYDEAGMILLKEVL